MNKDGSGYAMLHSFSATGADGCYPNSILESTNGILYGTTELGGSNNLGTVFAINKNGSGYTVLQNFAGVNNGDGSSPISLIEASDGALYGTTSSGGTSYVNIFGASISSGTVFKLNKNGSGYSVLSYFSPVNDGISPTAVTEASDGVLYGTTESGVSSSNSMGMAFKLDKDGNNFAVLASFTNNNPAGYYPWGRLVEGKDGALYGTTLGDFSSSNLVGTVFKLTKDGNGFAAIERFAGSAFSDGSHPWSGLVEGSDGVLYGTTTYGGNTNESGTIFMLSKDGNSYTVLRRFTGSDGDGSNPLGSLAKGHAGALYGTTVGAGDMNLGTVFRLFSSVAISQTGLGGNTTLSLAGDPGQTYRIQATTNLDAPFWEELVSDTVGTNGLSQFLDTSASNYPARFYRTATP